MLRGKRLGLRFRRQHPVGAYVLDFYCDQARLCVEVDSWWHYVDDRQQEDALRDRWLAHRHDIHVLRLSARLVLQDRDAAVMTILGVARERLETMRCNAAGAHPAAP